MKKGIIALFSVSITAGTICLVYAKLKDRIIASVIAALKKAAQDQEHTLDEEKLKQGLDKLYYWDLYLLGQYLEKLQAGTSPETLEALTQRIQKRKIAERAGLEDLLPQDPINNNQTPNQTPTKS